MEKGVIESGYPLTFHKEEAMVLGKHLKNRHNVVLIGMKRVGISNFLRFFLYNKNITTTFIKDNKKHVFIPVDLNDLVEREIFPFWTLTLKRIVDAVEKLAIDTNIAKDIQLLFLDSIQSRDIFLTIDSVRKSLSLLSEAGYTPTIFYIRFDRIKEVVTPEFFANLQGLKEATGQQLSYVFTSFRSLDLLAPHVFSKADLLVFSHLMYLRPVRREDAVEIYKTYSKLYNLTLSLELQKALFSLVHGYVRYLHLALIILHEKGKSLPKDATALSKLLLTDERMYLQSEELWESLSVDEQHVLKKVNRGGVISEGERALGKYLWETGMITEEKGTAVIFSPLFVAYVTQKDTKVVSAESSTEFTKKEQMLFKLLKENLNEICEREKIIETVWAEVEELGVSDWAIDRLVARVRNKLRMQKGGFEIQTIKTRGYKLISLTP